MRENNLAHFFFNFQKGISLADMLENHVIKYSNFPKKRHFNYFLRDWP